MRRIAFVLMAALDLCLPAAGQGRILRIAGFPLDPYVIEASGGAGATGAVIQYWKDYLGPKMGYGIEVVGTFPINRIEAMLKNGEIDVAALFTKIPVRDAQFAYPATPLSEVSSGISVLPDSPIKDVKKPEDLFGKSLGYIEGGFVPPFFVDPRIRIETVATGEDYREVGLQRLFAGRVDALLEINLASIRFYLRGRGYQARVRIIALPIDKTPVYSVFRKTAEGERLASEYDAANSRGRKDGVFEGLLRKYVE
jgi:ABC-type amino acid transport substrate-binding protein